MINKKSVHQLRIIYYEALLCIHLKMPKTRGTSKLYIIQKQNPGRIYQVGNGDHTRIMKC